MVEDNAEESKIEKKRPDGCAKFIATIFAIGLLYVGGWFLVWDVPYFGKEKILVFDFNCVAILFNNKLYGLMFSDRFFYSPFISWILFGVAVGCFYVGFSHNDEQKTQNGKEDGK